METYKKYLQDLIDKGASDIFINSSPEHAACIFAAIFNNAKEVKLFAGGLTGQISGQAEYQSALSYFLRKKGKLQILVQQYVPERPIYSFLKFQKLINGADITIKQTDLKIQSPQGEAHFCVADNKMYRVETNINSFQAYGSFNNPIEGAALSSYFDAVFNKSTPITL